jgi:hypothetical protein
MEQLIIPCGMNKSIVITAGKKNRPILFCLSMIAIIGSPFWIFFLCLIFK